MRPEFEVWALGIAHAISERGDCSRRQVGAALFRNDWTLVSGGYNGVARGDDGCLSGACPRAQSQVAPDSSYDSGPGTCIGLHAEANCLLAARESTVGCTLVVSCQPCPGCWRLIKSARLSRVLWATIDGYEEKWL